MDGLLDFKLEGAICKTQNRLGRREWGRGWGRGEIKCNKPLIFYINVFLILLRTKFFSYWSCASFKCPRKNNSPSWSTNLEHFNYSPKDLVVYFKSYILLKLHTPLLKIALFVHSNYVVRYAVLKSNNTHTFYIISLLRVTLNS